MAKFLGLFLFLFPVLSLAQAGGTDTSPNKMAISQGISSPSVNTTTLFSNGFTMPNPVAASYQSTYRMAAAVDGSDTTSFGVDVGVGDTQYGLALGVYSNACPDGEECDAYVRGVMSAIWGSFGIGFGVQEDKYTAGILLNPNGMHRIGFVAEHEDRNGIDNGGNAYTRSAFGLGYAFVMPQFTFSLDFAQQNYANINRNDDAWILSPGIAVRVNIFSVTLNYDTYINNTNNTYNNQVWFGLGAHITEGLQIAFYGEYVDRWTLMGAYYF